MPFTVHANPPSNAASPPMRTRITLAPPAVAVTGMSSMMTYGPPQQRPQVPADLARASAVPPLTGSLTNQLRLQDCAARRQFDAGNAAREYDEQPITVMAT